jgi:hypothetical protein
MRDGPTVAVLGFRPHTYWTAAVALAGEPDAPHVIKRSKIVFAAGQERFVYHQVAEMGASAAAARIAKVRSATAASAARGIAELTAAVSEAGFTVRLAVVPTGRARTAPTFADIVKSHTAIHAAEGDFYRDVVAQACGGLGLDVSRLAERDLLLEASRSLGVHAIALESRLKTMGHDLGPPWSEDQRLATLAAWIGIADLLA